MHCVVLYCFQCKSAITVTIFVFMVYIVNRMGRLSFITNVSTTKSLVGNHHCNYITWKSYEIILWNIV